jgi:hypothetical protein
LGVVGVERGWEEKRERACHLSMQKASPEIRVVLVLMVLGTSIGMQVTDSM